MRQGQQNRRGRNRGGGQGGGSSHNGGGNMNNNNNGGRRPQNSLSRSYESSGPDIKIRGTAMHIAEKYTTLARDAMSSGDSVAAENYLQHAEHYNRIILASQPQQQPQSNMPDGTPQQVNGNGHRYQPSDGFNRDFDGVGGDDNDDDGIINPRPSFLERAVNFHQQPQPVIPQQAFPRTHNQPAPPIRVNGAAAQPQGQPQPQMTQQPHAQPQPPFQPQPPMPVQPLQSDAEDDDADRAPRRRRRRPLLGEPVPRASSARTRAAPAAPSDDAPSAESPNQSKEPPADDVG